MRLVRRVFAGAAASLALGALFTGVALGAEPTADADASVTLDLGRGTDGELGVDGVLDELLGGTDDAAATTDAVASVDTRIDPDAGSTIDVSVGPVTSPDIATEAGADADADAQIVLDVDETSFAVAGRRGGSVFSVDLGAAPGGTAGTTGDVAAELALDAGTDDPADVDGVASLVIGTGTGANDASGNVAPDLGTGAVTEIATTGFGIVNGAVLGIQAAGTALLAGGAVVGGDAPAGRDAMAGPTGPLPGSLPDTAFGAGDDVALWGLLLAVLAGLIASARSLPRRRRR